MQSRRNRRGQRDLWKYGISGDLPIVLAAHGATTTTIPLVAELLKAHEYLRAEGIDLRPRRAERAPPSYRQDLQHHAAADRRQQPGRSRGSTSPAASSCGAPI